MQVAPDSFKDFVDTQLNEAQKNAVTPATGALLVIAGAGSGKTRVITARITHLILEEGVDPRNIVALTFTNKAAQEMKERITAFLGEQNNLPFVGTFHAYCLLLLRNNPHLLPFPHFSVLDSDDQATIFRNLLKKHNIEKQFNVSQLSYQISLLKNSMDEDPVVLPILRELFHAYEEEKNAAHAFDFDDLILNILRLLKKNSAFKRALQSRVRHLLVDEYQDTSTVQHSLLKEMVITSEGKVGIDSLCAVGDEDQSIYSWRGANVTNMLKFRQEFAPVTMVKIEQNYRSVNNILQAANSVIGNNKLRNPKNLWSEKKGANRIVHLQCRSGDQEAQVVAQTLKLLPSTIPMNSVAVLYRTHYQSRVLEEALIYHALPYKIIGGIRFYERKEIKDLLAYLKLIVNPFDRLSLLRVVNTPARGLGKKCETELLAAMVRNPFLDFRELIKTLPMDRLADLSAAHLNGLNKFTELFDALDRTELPSNLLQNIMNRSEYEAFLKESYDPKEAGEKIQNINELMRAVEAFEKNAQESRSDTAAFDLFGSSGDSTSLLELFLQDIALLQEKNDAENPQQQVQLMTLHAAKGLEFSLVIIAGLDDGILPSIRSLNTNNELEEERRLFYVGITRAKEYLLLLGAHVRNTYGQFVDQVRSRFISEITPALFTSVDIERHQAWQINPILQAWLGGRAVQGGSSTSAIGAPVKSTGFKTYGAATPLPPHRVNSALPGKKPMDEAATWYKNQKIQHKKFGSGIVTEVEKIGDGEFYVTAIFKIGKKKILSSFIEPA